MGRGRGAAAGLWEKGPIRRAWSQREDGVARGGGGGSTVPVSLFPFQGDPGESGAPGIQGEPGVKVSDSRDTPPSVPVPRLLLPAADPILHRRAHEESEGRREKPELPVPPGRLEGKGPPAMTGPRATP